VSGLRQTLLTKVEGAPQGGSALSYSPACEERPEMVQARDMELPLSPSIIFQNSEASGTSVPLGQRHPPETHHFST